MNEKYILNEIEKKNKDKPYFPEPKNLFNIKTDMNMFPYQRFFRGQRNSYEPHVWEREAGYCPLTLDINTLNPVNQSMETNNNTCFQIPCTTILPCQSNQNNFQLNTRSKVYTSP